MSRRAWAGIAGLTAVALAIRIAQLDQSLFGDEVGTYRIVAGHGIGRVFRLIDDLESTPPLHYLLAWLAAKVGDPTVSLRLPSLVAGTAMVPATFALGLRTVGRRAALFGAAVVALAPFAIFYSVEARAYATLGLFSVLSTLALLRALENRSWTRWALFVALTLAVLYTHYTGIFVVAAQGIWAVWRHRDRLSSFATPLRELVLSYGAVAIGYAPWIPSFLAQRRNGGQENIALVYPLTVESAGRGLLEVAPGHPLFPLGSLPGRAATATFLALVVAAAVLAVLGRRARQTIAADPALLALLAIAAPAGSILTSVFLPRNLISSLPAAALMLGAAVARAGRIAAPVLAAVLLGVLAVGAVKTFDPNFERPPYRDVARYIESHGRRGDPVLEISIDIVTPFSPLEPVLDRGFAFARWGHSGMAAALARAKAYGRLFLVVPQVGVLKGTPHLSRLRGFELAHSRAFAKLTVFDYKRPP